MWMMRRSALATVFLVQFCAGFASAAEVPCTTIITTVNHMVTRRQKPDISELAKKLDTQIVWVESCLKAYGRRYKRPGFESDGGRDAVHEAYEVGRDEENEDLEDPEVEDRR
jgi:hypothetical protein